MSGNPSVPAPRVLVCLTGRPSTQQVIRAAARIATERAAELYALHVALPGSNTRRSPEESAQLARNMRLAHDLGAQVEVLSSHRVAESILAFAHAHAITLIVLGAASGRGWRRLFGGDIVERVRGNGGMIEVCVITLEKGQQP